MELGGDRFLEIGPGNGILTLLLREKGLNVITSDINNSVNPSVAINLPLLPFQNKAIDVVLCFEVLEHLPWELFLPSLRELKRVASNKVIISLPNCEPLVEKFPKYSISWWAYWLKKIVHSILGFLRSYKVDYKLPPEHYWELGMLNIYSNMVINQAQQVGLLLKEDFRNPHFPYHHFFVFEVI